MPSLNATEFWIWLAGGVPVFGLNVLAVWYRNRARGNISRTLSRIYLFGAEFLLVVWFRVFGLISMMFGFGVVGIIWWWERGRDDAADERQRIARQAALPAPGMFWIDGTDKNGKPFRIRARAASAMMARNKLMSKGLRVTSVKKVLEVSGEIGGDAE